MAGDSRQPLDNAPSADADVPVDATYSLLERAKGGDREALEIRFARRIPTLRRWASGRLPRWARDVADTQDLVQDTVLQVFKRVEAFEPRGDGALHAYLRQTAMNRIRNEFRSQGRRPSLESLDEQPRRTTRPRSRPRFARNSSIATTPPCPGSASGSAIRSWREWK
jgi:DNA-directed RNA polymerase specialized sigma24 family protein